MYNIVENTDGTFFINDQSLKADKLFENFLDTYLYLIVEPMNICSL